MNPQRFGHKRTPAFVLAAFPQGAALLVLVAAALLAVAGAGLPKHCRPTHVRPASLAPFAILHFRS